MGIEDKKIKKEFDHLFKFYSHLPEGLRSIKESLEFYSKRGKNVEKYQRKYNKLLKKSFNSVIQIEVRDAKFLDLKLLKWHSKQYN